ncbi:MAG: hypothetical protein GY820_32695, partial [Gammaproteobacteria bacterium]|nr:hypothetical protein [Gammaproteobacteria bacterium]
ETTAEEKEWLYWNWKRRKKKEMAFKEQPEVKITTIKDLADEKTDSGTTPMDYTCTSGTSMRESISASGSQGLSSQQSASTTSALDDTRKGGRKLTDEEEAALVSGQEEGAPKKTEREQSGSPREEREKMELDVAVELESDVESKIEDVTIVGNGVDMEEMEEEEDERRTSIWRGRPRGSRA